MNKEQLIKEYDEKAKALRDEFISKLEDDKKEFKLTYPEDEETLYYIDLDGRIQFFDNDIYNLEVCYPQGELFYTEEEAKAVSRERKLLFKLQQWAKEKNGDWEPDWEDFFQNKAYITCFRNLSGQNKLLSEITCATNRFSKLPYFKSRELAQECIDIFGDKIKEVLC